ncbi:MAG: hypothetical protein AAFP19_03005 [Bacteroidota bacterium]
MEKLLKVMSILTLLVFPAWMTAQSGVEGYWTGTITHSEEGGYRASYTFKLKLEQKGDQITGKSYVYADDIYAVMEVKGTLYSGLYLHLKDEQITDHVEKEGMEWCMKKYQLILKKVEGKWQLEGHWQGDTSFSNCIPGKVFLKRGTLRA